MWDGSVDLNEPEIARVLRKRGVVVMEVNFATPAVEVDRFEKRLATMSRPSGCYLFRPGAKQPFQFVGRVDVKGLQAAIAGRESQHFPFSIAAADAGNSLAP